MTCAERVCAVESWVEMPPHVSLAVAMTLSYISSEGRYDSILMLGKLEVLVAFN